MKLSAQLRYDADPAAVYAMLTDPAFQDRKCAATGALAHTVDVDGATVTTSRDLPTDEVPDFVRTFVGPTLTVRQVEAWNEAAADGSRTGTLAVDIVGAPVKVTGTMSLAPDGAGTVQTIDADVKASVPLVGGKIEKAVEPALRGAIRVEEREGQAWLAG